MTYNCRLLLVEIFISWQKWFETRNRNCRCQTINLTVRLLKELHARLKICTNYFVCAGEMHKTWKEHITFCRLSACISAVNIFQETIISTPSSNLSNIPFLFRRSRWLLVVLAFEIVRSCLQVSYYFLKHGFIILKSERCVNLETTLDIIEDPGWIHFSLRGVWDGRESTKLTNVYLCIFLKNILLWKALTTLRL